MSSWIILAMAVAGGLGAVARFVVDSEVKARVRTALPVGTLLINATGSLLLGVLTALVQRHGASHDLTLVAGTGFCGGFTTFSTASVDTVRLVQDGRRGLALVYLVGQALTCVLSACVGWSLVA